MKAQILQKEEKGITLIALVITIIVLLILAGVTIATLTGDNGILTQSGKAKAETTIGEEKEILKLIVMQNYITNNGNSITKTSLEEVIRESDKKNQIDIIEGEENLIAKFIVSNHYYTIGLDGNIDLTEKMDKMKELTVKLVDSKNNILGEKIYTIIKNNYCETLPSIDGYEPVSNTIEGEISKSETISALYYLVCDDVSDFVFTGLDKDGNQTTDESAIERYMLGDGSNEKANALVQKDIKCIVKVPETYNQKPVTLLGQYAFYRSYVVDLQLANNIETISYASIDGAGYLEIVRFGKNLKLIKNYGIWACERLKKIIFNSNNFDIEVVALGRCNKWTEIEIDENNSGYKVIDNALYSKDGTKLILVPKGILESFSINEKTQTISKYALAYTSITSMSIPESITNIEEAAFNGSSLKTITIGKNVKDIGKGKTVFWNSSKLQEAIIDSPDIASSITSNMSAGALVYYATTIYINDNITDIGSYITENYSIIDSNRNGYIKYIKN